MSAKNADIDKLQSAGDSMPLARRVASGQLSKHNRVAQRGPDVPRQLVTSVGLVQDRNVALLGTARRIARHQQDGQAGKQHTGPLDETEPVDAAGHHDVAYQQVDAALTADNGQRFRGISGRQNV